MKKIKLEKITDTVEVETDRLCNKCRASMVSYIDPYIVCGLIDCTIEGGYDSPVLEDCTQYKFDLCESCLKELMDSFKIPPEIIEVPI